MSFFPPTVSLPNPMPQSSSDYVLHSQLGLQHRQSSRGSPMVPCTWQQGQMLPSYFGGNNASASAFVRTHTLSIIVSIQRPTSNKPTTKRLTNWNLMLQWAIYLPENNLWWIFLLKKLDSNCIGRCHFPWSHKFLFALSSKLLGHFWKRRFSFYKSFTNVILVFILWYLIIHKLF